MKQSDQQAKPVRVPQIQGTVVTGVLTDEETDQETETEEKESAEG